MSLSVISSNCNGSKVSDLNLGKDQSVLASALSVHSSPASSSSCKQSQAALFLYQRRKIKQVALPLVIELKISDSNTKKKQQPSCICSTNSNGPYCAELFASSAEKDLELWSANSDYNLF